MGEVARVLAEFSTKGYASCRLVGLLVTTDPGTIVSLYEAALAKVFFYKLSFSIQ